MAKNAHADILVLTVRQFSRTSYLSGMVPIILWKGTVLFILFDFNWLCWWVVIGENIILVSEYIIVDIE